jgi:hypothetical protein
VSQVQQWTPDAARAAEVWCQKVKNYLGTRPESPWVTFHVNDLRDGNTLLASAVAEITRLHDEARRATIEHEALFDKLEAALADLARLRGRIEELEGKVEA